jgi:hypothetical protein
LVGWEAIIGAPVLGAGVFMTPGRKKVAGETDPPRLMPPQPVNDSAITASIANRSNFQFNLTCLNYKTA